MRNGLLFILCAALLAAACGGDSDGGGSPPACQDPLASCSGACVDLQTDRDHCGACDVACDPSQVCQSGGCVLAPCPGAQTRCGGVCVDLLSDGQNCGACDNACTAPQSCQAGFCVSPPCPAGLSRCGAECLDLLTDEANCGACGLACPGTTRCQLGACPGAACSGVLALPSPPALPAGQSPVAIAVGDLDGDGVLDLLTAGSSAVGEARTFLGFGFGAFEPAAVTTLPAIPASASLESIDPGTDAHADLAVAFRMPTDGVRVYLGDGTGSFTVLSPESAGVVGPYPQAVLLADLDRDGDADLLVGTAPEGAGPADPNVRLLLGDGTGLFGLGTGPAPRAPNLAFTAGGDPASSPNGFAVADLDLNGVLDVAVSHALGITVVYRDPSGALLQSLEIPTPRRTRGVAAADLDGDGWTDLAAADPEGNGIFVALSVPASPSFGAALPVPAGLRPRAIVAADLDGDGRSDLLTADEAGGAVTVLRNTAPVGLVLEQTSAVVGIGPLALAAGLLDGDLHPDVAVADTAGNASVLLADGAGRLRAPSAFPSGSGAAIALFHADGGAPPALDAAIADWAGDAVVVRAGNGDGTFGPPTALALPPFSEPVALASGDLDGDGAADLAVALLSAGKIALLWGDGAGAFSAPDLVPTGMLGGLTGVLAVDMDGVNGLDLVASAAGSDEVIVLLSTGPRTFGAPSGTSVCAGPSGLAAGRLDDDGLDDVAVACETDGKVAVLLRDPAVAGAFLPPATLPAAPGASGVALGDLDGDGDLDLAVSARAGATAVVLLNDGAGGLGGGATFPACEGAAGAGVGDVDGDGIPDLALACPARGATGVLRGLGGGAFGPPLLFPTGGVPRGVALGDLDGDGAPEVTSANDQPAFAGAGGGLVVQRGACLGP